MFKTKRRKNCSTFFGQGLFEENVLRPELEMLLGLGLEKKGVRQREKESFSGKVIND